jgi:hypothetical protein
MVHHRVDRELTRDIGIVPRSPSGDPFKRKLLIAEQLMLASEKQITPEQVTLVQESFAKVALIADQAAIMFYDRLFELAPQVKTMFPADMTEQRR